MTCVSIRIMPLKVFTFATVLFVGAFCLGCRTPVPAPSPDPRSAQPTITPRQDLEPAPPLPSITSESPQIAADRVDYNGYSIERKTRSETIEGKKTEISF